MKTKQKNNNKVTKKRYAYARELIERTDHHNKIFTDLKVRKIAPKSAAQAETKAAIAVWQKLVVINRRNMVGPLQVL